MDTDALVQLYYSAIDELCREGARTVGSFDDLQLRAFMGDRMRHELWHHGKMIGFVELEDLGNGLTFHHSDLESPSDLNN